MEHDPCEQATSLAFSDELRLQIGSLPEAERWVLNSTYGMNGTSHLSEREIAEVIGCPVGHVSVLRRRAERRLGMIRSLEEYWLAGTDLGGTDEALSLCEYFLCGRVLPDGGGRGRPRRYCRGVCRQAAYRARRRRRYGTSLTYERESQGTA